MKEFAKIGRNMTKSNLKESRKEIERKGTLRAKNSLKGRDRGLEKTDGKEVKNRT